MITTRPLRPDQIPCDGNGTPPGDWVFVYRGRPCGEVLSTSIVDGIARIADGRIARRLICADGGRLECAAVRYDGGVIVLGEADEREIRELFGLAAAAEPDEAITKARAAAAALEVTADDVAKAKKADLLALAEAVELPGPADENAASLRERLTKALFG